MEKFDTKVIWTMNCVYNKGDIVEKHSHTFFHYIYVHKGGGKILIGNEEMPLIHGYIYLINPMTGHEFCAGEKGMSLYELKFETSDSEIFNKLHTLPTTLDVYKSKVSEIFRSMFPEFAKKDSYSDVLIQYRFYEILTLLFRCNETQRDTEPNDKKQPDKFSEVFTYINRNLQKPLTLAELAQIVHMESIYFLKQFKKATGTPPMTYVRNVRISTAKNLLLHSDMNITQISSAVGFLTVHHFSSCFKKYAGCSPAEYKKIHNKGL